MATVHPNPAGPVPRLSGGSLAVNPGMHNNAHVQHFTIPFTFIRYPS